MIITKIKQSQPIFLLWPIVAVLLLFGITIFTTIIQNTLFGANERVYTDSIDVAFLQTAIMTVFVHALSFIAFPLVALKARQPQAAVLSARMTVIAMGMITIAVQLFLRSTSGTISRLDCASSCVNTVMPEYLDMIVTFATLVVLFASYGFIIWLTARRENHQGF